MSKIIVEEKRSSSGVLKDDAASSGYEKKLVKEDFVPVIWGAKKIK